MKLLKLYSWIAGTMNDFTKQFADNKNLYNQARKFWNDLEGISLILILIPVCIGIVGAVYYYKWYNNKPGRRYTPIHWLYLFVGTILATLFITWVVEFFMVDPKLSGAQALEWKIAFGNAIYASGIYFLISLIWCNTMQTNAYKMFKY